MRLNSNFVNRFKLIWVVGSLCTNILLSENQKLCSLPAVPPRQEGRFAVVTNVGRDAVDAVVSLDERR
jgi:hypothetical protein